MTGSGPLAVMKTKLGPARPAVLRSPDGARRVEAYWCTAQGLPLNYEQSAAAVFRAAILVTDGKYPGRTPFRGVFGVVGGEGRLLIYDRFGLAVLWDSEQPRLKRRGIAMTAGRAEILSFLGGARASALGYAPTYLCPACERDRAEQLPAGGYMRMPLCARCMRHGKGERDWVGTWQCPHCGDRVKEDVLECPLCAVFALERGRRGGP